jgi:eukaryotic-like serine/threonine-protein kinase
VIASKPVLSEEKDKVGSLGPYVVLLEVARGALATVYLARHRDAPESTSPVAIKRLRPPFAEDPEFVARFTEEARRIQLVRHPNVVSILDVVAVEGEVLVLSEYVHGESLSQLIRAAGRQRTAMPRRVFVTIMAGVLAGLEAAHETQGGGEQLGIVHGDLSPHDVLVGLDGVPRVTNFGLAKGLLREHGAAESAQIRSKHAYMSPEQLRGDPVDQRTDVYSAGVMLWEGLTGRRLFDPKSVPEASDIVGRMQAGRIDPPSKVIASTPKALDEIVMKALAGLPDDRFKTAREMAAAIESAAIAVPSRLVSDWVDQVAGEALRERAALESTDGSALDPAVASSLPYVPLTSFIDMGSFAATSSPPVDPAGQGEGLPKVMPPPPLLPRPQPIVASFSEPAPAAAGTNASPRLDQAKPLIEPMKDMTQATEPKPVLEAKPATEPKPVLESKPATEPKPIPESTPAAEAKPVPKPRSEAEAKAVVDATTVAGGKPAPKKPPPPAKPAKPATASNLATLPKAPAPDLAPDETTQPDALRARRLHSAARKSGRPRILVWIAGFVLLVAAVWLVGSLLENDTFESPSSHPSDSPPRN